MPSAAARAAAEADPGAALAAAFAARLATLGPFEAAPLLAVAVSGGADSTALVLLADVWARGRGGEILALIVDHGLRDGSAVEARTVLARLARHGIAGDILTLAGLGGRGGVQARARAARHAALRAACQARGIAHLLLGHHAGDQAETVALRQAGGSGALGLAGMATLDETAALRVLRPLLDQAPERLRAFLRQLGEPWLEDPSNADPAFARARLRRDLTAAAYAGLFAQAEQAGVARAAAEKAVARELAAKVTFSPLGFALVGAEPLSPAALALVLRTVAGRDYAPPLEAVTRLARAWRPCTLAGARIAPAGRWRIGGWIIVREHTPPAVPAAHGARWGGFVLEAADGGMPEGFGIGARGASSRAERAEWGVPDLVMRRLPALWQGGRVASWPGAQFRPLPPRPAAGAPFAAGCGKGHVCGAQGDA